MWSLKHIEQLKAAGKIKDYTISKWSNSTTSPTGKIVSKLFNKKSKEKEWIEAQLFYWAREKGYNLKSEFKFHATRKWRFDWCVEEMKVAIEYNGIMSKKSRHTTITGYTGDMNKLNAAQALGWRVFQFTPLNYKDLLTELKAIN